MFAKPEVELFILITFSLFLASHCYHHRTPAALIQLQRCQLRCLEEEEHGNRHQAFCLRKCHLGYANAEGLDNYGARNQQGSKGEESPEEKEKYPYFFEGKRFQIHFRTELGEFKALERFSRRSELLNVIDNYRFAIYEAGPNAFLLPHHVDADYLLFVASGESIYICVYIFLHLYVVNYSWKEFDEKFSSLFQKAASFDLILQGKGL